MLVFDRQIILVTEVTSLVQQAKRWPPRQEPFPSLTPGLELTPPSLGSTPVFKGRQWVGSHGIGDGTRWARRPSRVGLLSDDFPTEHSYPPLPSHGRSMRPFQSHTRSHHRMCLLESLLGMTGEWFLASFPPRGPHGW